MDSLEFPVATCPFCDVRGPVYIEQSEILTGGEEVGTAQIVICPECVKIINIDSSFSVEWFAAEDAKYFGYKVIVDDGADGTE